MIHIFNNNILYISDTSKYVGEKNVNGGASGSTSTIAILRETALYLLPIENELSFFTFYLLGKGIILNESYTYYRIHSDSMTNRSIPGKQQSYLASITFNLSKKIYSLYVANSLNSWMINSKGVLLISYHFKSQGFYNKLEESLECKNYFFGLKYFLLMFFWGIRARRINKFHFKYPLDMPRLYQRF